MVIVRINKYCKNIVEGKYNYSKLIKHDYLLLVLDSELTMLIQAQETE